MTDLSLALG